ncbi:PAS domain S-box protein [Wenzhouxiangella sp. AB-CW3]|uniref:PAS domain S-box protein n=1 Tax=Wenzhouxiangella sp. AB-CW3 TaxID=2771012 RepID=UPI00168AA6E4|nr:PAS domain S-box protein [Wenzhouxiangella sp. AB-CW3]QOC23528.1 PAS domain S-box protein [Wenzhouxiangella sp. AB-CW3]
MLFPLLVVLSGAVAGDEGDASGTLIVSQDHAWPPFAWRNDAGEPEGLLIDLWRELGEQRGWEVEFRLVDWPDTITQVAEGRADVHGGLFRSREREELLDFSVELMPLSAFVFVEASLPLMGTRDLVDFEVGVVAGSMELEFVSEHHPDVAVREYANNDRMVQAALAGEVSVFVADYPVGMYLLDMHREPAAFRPLVRLYQNSLHAAVRGGDEALLREVNQALESLDEADLRRMLQRWMRSEQVEVLPVWLFPAIAGGGVVLALLVYAVFLVRRRRLLEQQVAERTRQLSEQEELFRSLFENAGAGIFLMQGECFTAVNNALVELSGYAREELLGRSLAGFIHPDDRKFVLQRARARQQGERVPGQYRYRIIRRDGEVRWVELTADVVFLDQGAMTVGTIYDLTEHYRLEQRLMASERKFRMLVENATDIVYHLSPGGRIEYVSPNWTEMLGHRREAVAERPLQKFVHADDAGVVRDLVEQVAGQGKSIEGTQFRLLHLDGQERWFSSNAAPLIDDEGQVEGISGIARDVTDEWAAEQERRRQHAFRSLIAEISSDILNAPINRIDAVMEHMLRKLGRFFDVDRAYIYRSNDNNDRIELIHEWSSERVEPTREEDAVLARADYPWWFAQAMEHMRGNTPFYIRDVAALPPDAESERRLFEGQEIETLVTMQLKTGERMIGFFGFDACKPHTWERELDSLLIVLANLLSDVFEKMRLEQELTRSSQTDPLTGLFNRRYLLAWLRQVIERYRSEGVPFALALLDIDHFKQFNDSHGHLAGDAVLESMARVVDGASRGNDVVGRYGGEEFVIVLDEIEASAAVTTMERVLDAIRQHRFEVDGKTYSITASSGLVAAGEFQSDQIDTDALIGQADRRLYRAKAGGRDRLVWQD